MHVITTTLIIQSNILQHYIHQSLLKACKGHITSAHVTNDSYVPLPSGNAVSSLSQNSMISKHLYFIAKLVRIDCGM